jgi:Domain of unknown function (DUF4386)
VRIGTERRDDSASAGWESAAHLGYLLTGLWTLLIGVATTQATVVPDWLGGPGIALGAGLMIGSVEFLGPNEERGWKLADAAIPFSMWRGRCWLLALGITLVA